MKLTDSILLLAVSLAGVSAQGNCDTDPSAILPLVSCQTALSTCSTDITDLASISSCECSYAKAYISCKSAVCGDTGSLLTAGDVISSVYCDGSTPDLGTTPTNTAGSATDTGGAASGATGGSGTVASETSQAGAEVTGIRAEVFVVAVAGLVGALV